MGVTDFLIREVRVSAEGLDGQARDFITISYNGYNETTKIEPPADYLPLPDEAMDTGAPEAPMVVGLNRNEDGDVEVMFSEPVFVEGGVELYVLDPETDRRLGTSPSRWERHRHPDLRRRRRGQATAGLR